ncbi:hypothetical protein ACFFX0_29415 [Citricoccus parietis]|uniref:Uncharacterized protein n=1 Tax=Citricoccus parietis TaxID=592307 RepID=A0ABV5G4L8_9MICC
MPDQDRLTGGLVNARTCRFTEGPFPSCGVVPAARGGAFATVRQ